MILKILPLLLISFTALAAVSDEELFQKRKQMTQACNEQFQTESGIIDKSFEKERDQILKANLKMEDHMAKMIELGGRIGDAKKPAIEKQSQCLLKLTPLNELSKKRPEERVFPAGL